MFKLTSAPLHSLRHAATGFVAWAALATLTAGATTRDRPNVVIIFADDLGYGDLSSYNPQSKIATPHLDRLAGGGARFTDAHTSSSVCTPSRYSLLTGRYAWRTRLKNGVFDGFAPPLIEQSRPTVASLLKAQGYRTACIGKWHLGMQWTRQDGTPETVDNEIKNGHRRTGDAIALDRRITGGPNAVGFDYYYGISASLDMSPYCWIENDRAQFTKLGELPMKRELALSHGPGLIDPGFKMDEVLPTMKTRAMRWLTEQHQRAPEQPFFLYLPLTSPHLPVVPSAPFLGKSGAGIYGDFVLETDDFVGSVTETLRKLGRLENTLIIFSSDNGGLWHQWDPVEPDDVANYTPTPRGEFTRKLGHQSNAALRGTKADIWEGGHRVPLIVHWPRRIKPSVAAEPVELTDVFGTVAEAAGVPLPAGAAEDSFSFLPVMTEPGRGKSTRPFLVHHSIRGTFAVREGDWVYIESRGSGGFSRLPVVEAKSGEATGQLYDLGRDLAQTKNRFLEEPARVSHFQTLLKTARAGAGLRTAPPAAAIPKR